MKVNIALSFDHRPSFDALSTKEQKAVEEDYFLIDWDCPFLPTKGDTIDFSFIKRNPLCKFKRSANFQCLVTEVYYAKVKGIITPHLFIELG